MEIMFTDGWIYSTMRVQNNRIYSLVKEGSYEVQKSRIRSKCT